MQDQFDFQKETPTQPDMPMGWHKFLIYFSLWAGAVVNLINGFQLLTGAQYEDNADWIYSMYGGLRGVDMLFGAAILALAAACIYVRFQLAGYKRNAPNLLMYLYVANVVVTLAYPLLVSMTTPLSFGEVFSATSLVGPVAFIFINKTYYEKRMHLFVN